MKFTVATVIAAMAIAVSAQGVTISLPSGVTIPSGVTLPSGVAVVPAGATSTTTAQANANNRVFNKRFNRRQGGGGAGGGAGGAGITGISGFSFNLAQQTETAAAQQTNGNAAE